MLTVSELQARIQSMGVRLSEARSIRQLDQQEVSTETGISRAMISDFERGVRPMMSEHLFKLADCLCVRPEWLLTGEGVMSTEGPSLARIRDEAMGLRLMEVDFIAAVLALIRKFGCDKTRTAWALASCIRAYWGVHWLGGYNPREVSLIVERLADARGLDLIEILESTGNEHASRHIAELLAHRGIDAEAFEQAGNQGGHGYEISYRREIVRSVDQLLETSRKRGLARSRGDDLAGSVESVIAYYLR